jgi:2,4-dienoyl-CoA reductase-like NADH-dependent reductase (Old Yellow Enzyme family)
MLLFAPSKIGALGLKNRLAMAPVSTTLGRDGFASVR